MPLRFLPLIFAFALTCHLAAASDISSDEVAVRAVYSGVVLLTQVDSIYSSHYSARLSTEPQLTLRLRAIQGGPVSEILSMPLSKAVTVPSGQPDQSLMSTPGQHWMRGLGSSVLQPVRTLQVTGWGSRYGFSDSSRFDTPIRVLLETDLSGPHAPNSRYLMFSVVVSARGEERTYRALALFKDEAPRPTIVDYILGSPERLAGEHVTSDLLDLPRTFPLRQGRNTKLDEFLRSIAVSGECIEDPVTQLCCDPISEICGIPSRLLNAQK